MNGRLPLVYILAPSFSGSTLLTCLLAQHSAIATVGELKATKMGDIRRYRCSCGTLIEQCPFWTRVARECRKRDLPFDLGDFGTTLRAPDRRYDLLLRANVRGVALEALRRLAIENLPPARRTLAAKVRRNFQLAALMTAIQGGRVFLDASKDATRLLHFIESDLFDVRVIYLQRDGRAVTTSIVKHSGSSFDAAASYWARNMRGLENMRSRLDGSVVFDLKYEELCTRPKEKLGAIFTWLGLDDVALETSHLKRGDFHILGNTMRLSSIAEIRLDEKWRMAMGRAEEERFMFRFGRLQERLGYV